MTESLVVDPSRLKSAGATLKALEFPAPPAPMSALGADAVSAAINETLPVIESPVIQGLPAVKAMVTRTGSSIVAAANIYAEADQALGEHVDDVRFPSAFRTVGGPVASGLVSGVASNAAKDAPGSQAPEAQPASTVAPVNATPNALAQVGEMAQVASPVVQNLQTIMPSVQQAAGSMGSMGSTGAPTQLADEINPSGRSPAEETDHQPEALVEGGAPGDQVLGGSVPEPLPAGQREAAASHRPRG